MQRDYGVRVTLVGGLRGRQVGWRKISEFTFGFGSDVAGGPAIELSFIWLRVIIAQLNAL